MLPSTDRYVAPSMAGRDREMQLLLCCARRELGPAHVSRLRLLLGAGIDWERCIALARRHRMLPLVWWHLRAEALPPAAASLKHAFLVNAGAMLRLSGELLQIVELFQSHGITVVPYKGPALGEHLYGNLALRHAGDLDILVRRHDVVRARALLLDRGYEPRHELSPGGSGFMRQSRYSEELEQANGLRVELHWAFTNGDIALPLDLDQLEPRLVTTELGGRGVPMFGAQDLLLVLCVHGCKHRWDRLEWLCGVAELLRSGSGQLDWDALLHHSTALGVRRMMLLGVLLAHDLLGAPVPASILAAARGDGAVPLLAAAVPALLAGDAITGDGTDGLGTDVFRFRLRERWRDRLRFVWYRVTTPSRPESWYAVAIGGRWLPVHGIVRPFRVVAKLLPALWHHRPAFRRRS